MSEQYQFIVRKGPKVGQIFRLLQENVIIGRDPLADIVLNDPEISRQHAKLVKTTDGYVIEDFGSTNGTYIDGQQLEPGHVTDLLPGQLVSMGSGVILLYGALSDTPSPSDTDMLVEQIQTPSIPLSETPLSSSPVEPIVPFEIAASSEAPRPAQSTTPPLVPSSNEKHTRSNRSRIVLVLLVLIVGCLLFALSAYYIWGDPLMRMLGVY